ncbi:MAG: peroxiredoxin [Gammaproteobacteria bacterium]|nr:peroxiredoxin [Gammaproteobacteria bacterium]
MSNVQLGQAIPAFSLEATSETTITADSLKGHNTVIYFYPKDSTPGCTTEGQNFRDSIAEFEAANTVIYGASPDSLKSHENFKGKQEFPFELISDPDKVLAEIFGVWQLKKNYGREYMGIVRSTFLIDANGVLKEEWRNIRVKGHVEKVLEAAQAL